MAPAPEQQHPPAETIRVVDTALVHPAVPSPPETSLPLTFFDIFWLHAPPVQRVFFYRLDAGAEADPVVSNLKRSLSQALRTIFPLAGRLRLAPGTANRYELHYRPGDSVAFTVAEYNDDDGSLEADEPREVSRLAPLAPPLPDGGAVLALQATVLKCGGLALGVTVHHAAGDGAASTHFLHTWAACCAGITGTGTKPPPVPPVIDRTLISDPTGLYDAFCPTTENTNKFAKVSSAAAEDQLLFGTFVLSRAHLQRVKDLVAAEAATRGVAPPPRCSTLVATLGLIWSCYRRANTKPGSNVSGGKNKTCLGFPVDYRPRMDPPLPATYFGNCVGAAIAIASRAELASSGATGLWAACAAVAASIQEAGHGFGKETSRLWKERVMEEAGMSVLSVAGSPRFRVYDLDFGFGRPAKVDIVSVARTGAIALAESRVGDGGMEVGLALPPDGMAAFRKCFADAVAGLDQDAGRS
ncbi:hypothetical protein PR202_ga24680 [Eleusine coracana subsp. coracana]|uniref:Uncharacterized protein n=1 Tax=Eleusine coracana subsp. coracana TaxID=191504 RepID=A0AAV5D9H6_ELECO|nr:hypothetical protein QOZ80_9AG0676000 [Eleusine coracana subsp. coracana]GJN06906.1 hypothetical protein PR202_ga24680 [Eleusine coracana subsp. coracana]